MKTRTPVLWTLGRIRRRIPEILIMTAAHMVQAAFGVLFALGTRDVIDSAISADRGLLVSACIKQGRIIAVILFTLTLYRHLREKLNAQLDRDWKKDILHGLLHGEYADVSRYHSAELLNRMNNDVKTVDDGVLTLLPNISAMVVRLGMAAAVLAALDPAFTAIILAIGVAVIIATGLLRRRLKTLHKDVSRRDGIVSGFIQEIMEKLLMVQAMDVSGEVENRADLLMKQRYALQRKRKNVSLFANTAVSLMHYGAGFLALTWCAFRLMRGEMTFGSLTAVTQLVNQLQNPFVNLSNVIPKYIAMVAASERLMELEKIQGQPDDSYDGAELYEKMEAICGENLTFAYERDTVLENADFRLKKGSFAVITGQSGIGKSTLLKLLLGVFKCKGGQLYTILNSNETPAKLPLDRKTRRLFAYVPQGNLILSGTIKENIVISHPQASDSEIFRALYVADAEDFVKNLPLGLDTPLGESGAGLSEGQLQRIAIARAILGGAPILLLDECTSALDEQTERTVLKRISRLENRTCIAVTHRPAALEICDCQLEIADRKIKVTEINK